MCYYFILVLYIIQDKYVFMYNASEDVLNLETTSMQTLLNKCITFIYVLSFCPSFKQLTRFREAGVCEDISWGSTEAISHQLPSVRRLWLQAPPPY